MALFSLLLTTCMSMQGVKTQCTFSGVASRSYTSGAACVAAVNLTAATSKDNLLKAYPTANVFSKGSCFTPAEYTSVLRGIPEFSRSIGADYYTFNEYD